jgi:hypothetical protein
VQQPSIQQEGAECLSMLLLLLCRSLKLWSLYTDLEESMGTLESASAVYDRMLELRLATPQIILNYTTMLQVGTMVVLHPDTLYHYFDAYSLRNSGNVYHYRTLVLYAMYH